MPVNDGSINSEQFTNAKLGSPNGLALQPQFQARAFVRLVHGVSV